MACSQFIIFFVSLVGGVSEAGGRGQYTCDPSLPISKHSVLDFVFS